VGRGPLRALAARRAHPRRRAVIPTCWSGAGAGIGCAAPASSRPRCGPLPSQGPRSCSLRQRSSLLALARGGGDPALAARRPAACC
jgi:hypothetical protein